jgi:hypothetical protein
MQPSCYKVRSGDATEPDDWRRFVSEAEVNQQIADLLRKQADAEKGLTSLEIKLAQLADRFHELAGTLRRHLSHTPTDLNVTKDEALRNSLKFGGESGVNVDGLFEMLSERARLTFTIEDCKTLIQRLR